MNILIYKWKVFNQADVKSAFEYFGHSVDMYEEKPLSSDSITGIKEHDYVMLADVFREYFHLITFLTFLIYVNRQEENMWHGQWIVHLYRFIISLYLTAATIYLYLISFFIMN